MTPRRGARLAALPVLAAALAAAALPEAVLAPGWERHLVHYATVDDPDRRLVRHIFANPAALAAPLGAPAPPGTILVLAEARARLDAAGQPVRDPGGRFVAEPGWTALLVQRKPAEAWVFARLAPDGTPLPGSVAACAACHDAARAAQDHTFTWWDRGDRWR